MPTAGRIDGTTILNPAVLRRRARNAYTTNPHAFAAVEAWTVALVGTGARANPSHPDPDARGAITAAEDAWAETATIDGVQDWWGQQVAAVRSLVVDGEAFIQIIETPAGLRLRQLPAEMIDETGDGELNNGGYIVGGVEHDRDGQRVAYHVRRHNPSNPWAPYGQSVRIDAADMVHLYRPTGPGQVRGVSWLAPIMDKLNDVDRLSESLLTGAAVAAAHAGFFTGETGVTVEDALYNGRAPSGSPHTDIEPGTVKVLPAGIDVKFSTPQQAQQTDALMSSELRAVAVGMGVPAHLVSGDLTRANYSSLRADLVAFRQRVEQIQYGVIAPQLLKRVHERAVTSLVLTGALDAPDFFTDRRAWTAADHLFPAMPWVDPAKDAAAYRELIDAGLTSRRQVVAERGWAIEPLDAEIAADRQREAALGLSFGKPAAVAPQPEGQGDDD